jgi:hypothetical protein
MVRQFRLLVMLVLLTAVGLAWPATADAQRAVPRGARVGSTAPRTGVAVPRTYYGSRYYRPYYYPRSYYSYYPRYYAPYYYRPYYYSPFFYGGYYPGFSFGFGIGFGFGWGGYGGAYGYPYYGYPAYGYPAYGYPYPYARAPYPGYAPGNMVTAQPTSPPPDRYESQRPAPIDHATDQAGYGTLSIRVNPSDAVILIDGEAWDRPNGDNRLSIDLPEGSHQIEIRKQGYGPYLRTVDVRSGRAFVLNVSLSPGGLQGRLNAPTR